MDVWNAPMVQSSQPFDMEAADRGIRESRSSQLSTLMIDIPGDLV